MQIFVNLGSAYLKAVQGIEEFTEGKIIYASGRLGERAKQMKEWILHA